MTDPVELVADALGNVSRDHRLERAHAALLALHDAGWRLVRVADAWPGDNGGTAMLVDEEYRP